MGRTVTEENLPDLLLHETAQDLQDTIDTIHPADILDLLHRHKEHAQNVLNRLPDDIPVDIAEEEDDEDKYEPLERFSDSEQRYILDEMSSDETIDLMGELEEDEQADILKKMDSEDQEDTHKLMSFDAESTGGTVTTEFICMYTKDTVKDTLQSSQKNIDEEMTYYLYVVGGEGVLKGVMSPRDIVASSFDIPIMGIVNPNVETVSYSDDQEKVTHRFERYGFTLIPVVDEQQHMLGVTESDDIIDVIQEENTEDIHHLGGVNKEERVDSSVRKSFSGYIPWLVVNLLTTVSTVAVVNTFEATIAQAVTLATVMPTVTGVSGNTGTQTLTTVVRGLSLGELTKENAAVILLKEVDVGILNDIVIGIVVAFGAMLVESNPIFRPVTGATMFLSTVPTNLTGYFIPIMLERLRMDPALTSGVFVTTVTSAAGSFMFLGLAVLMPPYIMQRMIHNMSR